MKRPTIVLVDSDPKYLRPLELKFLEELGEKAELEIITETGYFKEYFEQPKSIDALVIDEGWYTDSLEYHDIKHIFILADSQTAIISQRSRKYIFKYSSSSEIYETVLRALKGKLVRQEREDKRTKVVMVTSASGGTGKTTIALGISAELAERMKNTLYIDAERMHTFHRWFSDTEACDPGACTLLQQGTQGIYRHLKPYIRNEGFDYMPPFKAALATMGISVSFYKELIREIKESGDYDIIIVDTDAVFDEDKAVLMTFADTLITVVNQTKTSVWATNELLKNVRVNASDKYIFICNNFDEKNYNALVSREEQQLFFVNEYVCHIKDYDMMTMEQLKNNKDIQKISYLAG